MTKLPDDPRDWPTDSFEIFGVPNTTDLKELKRAYFRLIKIYRPDSEPAAFQRIHEAYESAKRYLKDRKTDHSAALEAPVESAFTFPVGSSLRTNGLDQSFRTSETPATASKSPGNEDSGFLIRFWELAAMGLWDETEGIIAEIHNPHDRQVLEYSQYFLQRAASIRQNEGKAEKRIEILLKLIEYPKFQTNALSFLEIELQNQPKLATASIFSDKISRPIEPRIAHLVARLRWKAVGVNQPEIVVSDMNCLREHFSNEVVQSAAEALEYTLWRRSCEFEEHNESCVQIVNDEGSWHADMAELLSETIKERIGNKITLWQAHDVGVLLPYCRTGFSLGMVEDWEVMVSKINGNRKQAFQKLGRLTERFPYALSFFNSGLERFVYEKTYLPFDDPSDSIVRIEVAAFLRRHGTDGFNGKARVRTVEFCIDNRISPTKLGLTLDQFTSQRPENLLWRDAFQQDTTFQCIYNAGIAELL